MPNSSIKVGLLKPVELEEADRICRVAFGTFLGVPQPADFMGDRSFVKPRFRSPNVKVLAARAGSRLIGSNLVTQWGSFGFFGPLTILPEYWDQGVAQRLLESTMALFDRWGVRHTGLFTFPQSAKHLGLYRKFGYWPRYLTQVMTKSPAADARENAPVLLSTITKNERQQAIEACAKLTNKIDPGLDLSGEIKSVIVRRTGDVVLNYTKNALEAFAVCLNGPGSEGGAQTCYVKFGAARGGPGADTRFDNLLDSCEAFAASRGANVEAGVNMAREHAYQLMHARGYKTSMVGVAMQRPHLEGFNRPGVYVIDDWR